MRLRAIATAATLASLMCFSAVSGWAQLAPYSQDFEAMNQADGAALSNDGWLIFGNVFNAAFVYQYGYGVFTAPNNPGAPGFCLVAAGEGGAPQGAQQMVAISDYQNTDHANPDRVIEANVFQEMGIAAVDVGSTWIFSFDAKLGDLAGQTTALAFIKTLDPNNGFATTNFLTEDTTAIPSNWGTYTISIPIDLSLVGQRLQIGFSSQARLYEASGVFYDNINFAKEGPVAVEQTTWSQTKALYR